MLALRGPILKLYRIIIVGHTPVFLLHIALYEQILQRYHWVGAIVLQCNHNGWMTGSYWYQDIPSISLASVTPLLELGLTGILVSNCTVQYYLFIFSCIFFLLIRTDVSDGVTW